MTIIKIGENMTEKFNINKMYNFAATDYEGFNFMSLEEKQKILSDWNTMALHPILASNNTWMILFAGIEEGKFFANLKKQENILKKIILEKLNINKNIFKKFFEQKTKQMTKSVNNISNKTDSEKNKDKKEIENDCFAKNDFLKILLKEQIRVAIDGNNINEKYIKKCIRVFDKLIKLGYKEIKVLVSSSDKSKQSKIDYYYSEEQLTLLNKLQEQLEFYNNLVDNNDYTSQLKFSEFFKIPFTSEQYNQLWTLEDVTQANEYANNIVYNIINKKLSPLETVIYIYRKLTNDYMYKLYDDPIKLEGSQGILGTENKDKSLICSGISSYFKLIIDKLNNSNLKSEFLNTKSNLKDSEHTFNYIQIKDSKYKINGTYGINSTFDMKTNKNGEGEGFCYCLFQLNELFKQPDYLYTICFASSRVDQTIQNFEYSMKKLFNKNMQQNETQKIENIKSDLDNSIKFVQQISNSSEKISSSTIIKAYLNVLDKFKVDYDFEKIKDIIDNSIINAVTGSSVKSNYSWLDLTNKIKIMEDFTVFNQKYFSSAYEKFLDKNIKKSLISNFDDSKTFIEKFLLTDEYKNENYKKLLENIKKHVNCKKQLNEINK